MKRNAIFSAITIIFSLYTNFSFAQDTSEGTLTMKGSPMGVAWGFAYGYGTKPEIFLPQLHSMGVHLTKLYLFWQQVEPTKNQFDWSAVDAFLGQLSSSDEALLAVFSSSLWATKLSSQTLPPSPAKEMDNYYQFVNQLVKHCKGKIKLWQNDCEPNNPIYWSGTVDEFINQSKIFYKAVKDADPASQVVIGGYDGLFNPPGMPPIPGQDNGLAFFSKVIKEASAYFDIFDLRLYANPYTIQDRVKYFKQKLAETGTVKPIICTEYNGPGFYGFPVNFKYISVVMQWQQSIASRDTASFLKLKNPLSALYDSIHKLAPQTQMFMMGCSPDLNDKYYRMQCRDIIMRNVLSFASGVQKTMYWDLWHDTHEKNDVMTLMFGKNKLMDYENGKLTKPYPQVDAIKRMTSFMDHMQKVKQIVIPDKKSLYLFEITKSDKHLVYVAWERRDYFTGENQPDTHYLIPWTASKAKATDVFGKVIPATVDKGMLSMDISLTPVFIE